MLGEAEEEEAVEGRKQEEIESKEVEKCLMAAERAKEEEQQ